MMRIIKRNTEFDFVGKHKIALFLSALILLSGLISYMSRGGLNVGIDFSGGTMVQLLFEKEIDVETLRKSLKGSIFGESEIQQIGMENREVLIRANASDASLKDAGEQLKKAISVTITDNKIDIRRAEMVGPKVGKDLRLKAMLAFLYAMGFMLIYVWWRFELSFGVGAILALLHDVLITFALMSLFNIEFDLKTVAALLTVVGYSINDTMVVYDRIRENLLKSKKETYISTINKSINQTMSRTILTSLTSLMVVVILFFFGGEVIHGFSFILIIGVIIGTYSSIFIASPIVLLWEKQLGRD